VVFMITSISLSMITTKRTSKSILETTKQQSTQPANKKSEAAPIAVPSREQILKAQEAAEAKQKQQAPPAPKPAESKSPAK
jgi:hypothetical protein